VKSGFAQLKHHRLENAIREMVQSLPVGAKLPGERQLAASYHCNFLTVRKALKSMVDDGTIVRRLGSGTFVANHSDSGDLARQPKARSIGILIHRRSDAQAYRTLEALARASIAQNIELRPVWIQDFDDNALAQVNMLKNEHCIAMVLPWVPVDAVDKVRKFVSRCPLPSSLPLIIPGLEDNCFEHREIFGISNTTVITEEICRYSHSLGHERIAFLGPDSADDPILQKKISGYVHYTARENLATLCAFVPPGAPAIDRLAEQWRPFRKNLAIICHDDQHALRFMTAMHKLGCRAPEDYCIIGQHDTEASRYSDPPLTTGSDNFDYIGHWLLKSAEALANKRVCQSTKMPRLPLFVRSTCGGSGKITDAFRSQFKHIDIMVEDQYSFPQNHAGTPPLKRAAGSFLEKGGLRSKMALGLS
jgi:DNA-binding LacI/PurR family transcriptional regulator